MKTLLNLPKGANTKLLMDIIAKQQIQLALNESDLNYAEEKMTESIASLNEASCSLSQASSKVSKVESKIEDLEYCYHKLHELAMSMYNDVQKHLDQCHKFCFAENVSDHDARHNITRQLAIINEKFENYLETLNEVE